ncbi:MAG: class I SAM-dependent methyltransferase [Actinomycetota bacterium]
MAGIEKRVLASRSWAAFSTRLVAPWVLRVAELPVQAEVLEVGSGGGGNVEVFVRRFPGWRITASDYDPDMVELARHRLEPLADRVNVAHADATSLAFPDGSFDLVISIGVWHHVGDWGKALTEAARVLRPGGYLALADLLEGFFPGPMKKLFPPETPYRLSDVRDALGPAGFSRWRVRPLRRLAYRLVTQAAGKA